MGILEEMRDLLKSIDSKIPGNGPKPPDKKWPNEPKNFQSIADWPMKESPDQLIDGDFPIGDQGFRIIYNVLPGTKFPVDDPEFHGTPRGYSLQSDDAEKGKVFDFCYPKGMRLGTAPSTVYKAWSAAQNWGYREIYCAWWGKLSDPYDFDNVGQKMTFLFNGGGGVGGQAFMSIGTDMRVYVMPEYMDPPPGTPGYRNRAPNQPDIVLYTPGVWHLSEWYMRIDTHDNPSINLTKWWLDGKLQGEYTDIWNAYPFDMFQFSPTFGGNGEFFKQWDDHWCANGCYISIPK